MSGRMIARLASVAALTLAPTIALAIVTTDGNGIGTPSAVKLYPGSPSNEATGASSVATGMTSGPAVDTPTTLGTSGLTTATPHQTAAIRDQSSSVTRETGTMGENDSAQSPGGPAVGVAGMPGGKSGPATATTTYRPKHYPQMTEENTASRSSDID
jgi:hypothetical protein